MRDCVSESSGRSGDPLWEFRVAARGRLLLLFFVASYFYFCCLLLYSVQILLLSYCHIPSKSSYYYFLLPFIVTFLTNPLIVLLSLINVTFHPNPLRSPSSLTPSWGEGLDLLSVYSNFNWEVHTQMCGCVLVFLFGFCASHSQVDSTGLGWWVVRFPDPLSWMSVGEPD